MHRVRLFWCRLHQMAFLVVMSSLRLYLHAGSSLSGHGSALASASLLHSIYQTSPLPLIDCTSSHTSSITSSHTPSRSILAPASPPPQAPTSQPQPPPLSQSPPTTTDPVPSPHPNCNPHHLRNPSADPLTSFLLLRRRTKPLRPECETRAWWEGHSDTGLYRGSRVSEEEGYADQRGCCGHIDGLLKQDKRLGHSFGS